MKKCPFCAEEIQDAAIVCRFCGRDLSPQGPAPAPSERPPERHPFLRAMLIVMIAIAISIAGLIGLAVFIASGPADTVGQLQQVGNSSAGRAQRTGLTLANYHRITEGMSYPEVVQILGKAGTEQSRVDLGGITTVMYSWEGSFGANMNAMFQNGKLVSKAQFGLR